MTVTTLKAIRRASLVALTTTDHARAISALKRVQAMTAAHGSPAEARALAEIADYWANETLTDSLYQIPICRKPLASENSLDRRSHTF